MPKAASAKRSSTRHGTGKTAYEIVTSQIIQALEAGVVPWRQPWVNRGAAFPRRMSTGSPYRGINVFLLGMTALDRGFRSPWWGSLKQIRERGGRVRDEEFAKPVLVIFWKDRTRQADDEPGQETQDRKPPVMRFYKVWNAEQCDGLPGKYQAPDPAEGTFVEHQPAELVIKNYLHSQPSLTIHHGGDQAYWDSSADEIHLPEPSQFHSAGLYYSVKFHEITHSTGRPDRLNRDTEGYAASRHVRGPEELVAEMGAAMLAAITGIDDWFDDSTSYIGSWLKIIKGDPKMVIHAGARAQRAVDYILDNGLPDEDE